MSRFSIRDEHTPKFGRQVLTLWSGAFASDHEGDAWELPGHDGYMVALEFRGKVRVACESPRTTENFERVDAAINAVRISRETETCTPVTGHLPGSDHRWQECPTYHD